MTHFDGCGHFHVHCKGGRSIQSNPDWKSLSDHDPIEVAAGCNNDENFQNDGCYDCRRGRPCVVCQCRMVTSTREGRASGRAKPPAHGDLHSA
jgi:hypothetical protein